MARRRTKQDEDQPRKPDRSWSTRLAWLTLVGGAVLIVTRMSVATVVEVHGNGMAPTLVDGDHILLLRDRWGLERGDVVVYDPMPVSAPVPSPPEDGLRDAPRAPSKDGSEYPDARREPRGDMRNTAVIEREDIEALQENWEKVQARSDGIVARSAMPLRLGRVIALPGDTVTFHHPGGALGLAINGDPLQQKPGDSVRLALEDEASDEVSPIPVRRSMAYESTDDRRYPVLVGTEPAQSWTGFGLPPAEDGPVDVEADGYLVLADNRDEGACCDSRVLGFVSPEQIRGRVVVRLAGEPGVTPDLDPRSRGFLWKP